jgi:plasmid stabilization system protein ParE
MAVIIKRPLAELDLLDIWEFIAENSPDIMSG